ncbi:MAG: hypothetical protein KGS45_12350 [Planctomycetes bacterium]|nr:hypothetical protein [Planctomycetota bacterium]
MPNSNHPISRVLLILSLLGTIPACAHRADTPNQLAAPNPTSLTPLEREPFFTRLAESSFSTTFTSGEIGINQWRWGPGKFSIRRTSMLSQVAIQPWSEEIIYWQPVQKSFAVLHLHADAPGVGRGLSEGTLNLSSTPIQTTLTLYQPRAQRTLAERWLLPDHNSYHAFLLEDSGAGFQPLVDWVYTRVPTNPLASAPIAPATPAPPLAAAPLPAQFRAFESLINRQWISSNPSSTTSSLTPESASVRTSFEWLTTVQLLRIHITSPASPSGPSAPSPATSAFNPSINMEVYIYQHMKFGDLCCLALAADGAVYQGKALPLMSLGTVTSTTLIAFDLTGESSRGTTKYRLQLDRQPDTKPEPSIRQRVWSLDGSEPALVHDLTHAPSPQ